MTDPRDPGPCYEPEPELSWGDIGQQDVCYGDPDRCVPHVAGTSVVCRKCRLTGGAA